MKKELENKFRLKEAEYTSFMSNDCYYVVRVDGRGFSKFTKNNFKKPFDQKFYFAMKNIVEETIKALGLNIIFAYSQSDEISFLFKNMSEQKDRKVVTLTASMVSVIASRTFGQDVTFDGRLLSLDKTEVVDYFDWRVSDCQRNALNNACYWKFRNDEKLSPRQADRLMSNMDQDERTDFVKDIEMTDWIKNGFITYFKEYEKEGMNKITGEKVIAKRRCLWTQEVSQNTDIESKVNEILDFNN